VAPILPVFPNSTQQAYSTLSIQIQLSILKRFLWENFSTKCHFFTYLTLKFRLEMSESFEVAEALLILSNKK
jgi:hypothetical protein